MQASIFFVVVVYTRFIQSFACWESESQAGCMLRERAMAKNNDIFRNNDADSAPL